MVAIFSLALAFLVVLLINPLAPPIRITFRPKVVLASRQGMTYYDENGTGSSPGVE